MLGREPCARFDLVRMQRERPFVLTAVYPDVFHARFGRGSEFEESLQWPSASDPKLLAQFADGACVVVLAAIEMTRRRRIPRPGEAVLFHRALLQKNLTARIENQNVNGAVLQPEAMNLRAGVAANDLITVVHNVENLFAHDWYSISTNFTKVSKSTCSARIVSGKPTPAKAARKRSSGQSSLRRLSIILRRCEKPRFTSLRKTPPASFGSRGDLRRTILMHAESTSGGGKKQPGGILK